MKRRYLKILREVLYYLDACEKSQAEDEKDDAGILARDLRGLVSRLSKKRQPKAR